MLNDVLSATPLWGAVVAVITALGGYAVQRVQNRAAIATALAKATGDDRTAAFDQLMKVVEALRTEVADLRNELDEERARRRERIAALQKELDEALEGKAAAERINRALRQELHGLRNAMQNAGVAVPPSVLPPAPPIAPAKG